jgi:CRP-like cAMP-binding protein
MQVGSVHSTQLQFLKHVQEPLRSEVAHRLRLVRATKGRTLVEKGSRSADVFFLLEGRAKVLLYSSTGREVCVHDISPGDVFGDIAVLDGEDRSASIVASSDVTFALMRGADFMLCLENSAPAATWLARRLATGVRRLTEQFFELSALNVQTRIHCELLRLAQKGEDRNGSIEVRPAPTHAELASRIGTHREAVTREMRVLSDDKIIRHARGKLMIMDIDRLEQAARK